MTDPTPSKQDVNQFIGATFRSVWSLEVLCYLKLNRDRSLPPAEIVAALRGSELVVAQSLTALLAAGLVVVDEQGTARYCPASDGLERLVEATTAYYAKSPDAVRRRIVAAANPGISAFADAFRLRRE